MRKRVPPATLNSPVLPRSCSLCISLLLQKRLPYGRRRKRCESIVGARVREMRDAKRQRPCASARPGLGVRPAVCSASQVTERRARGLAQQHPRNGFRGASSGAGLCRARRKRARFDVEASSSMGDETSAVSPSSHCVTLHDQGNPHPARPRRITLGTGNGRSCASTGSQRCSCSMSGADAARREKRTAKSSPSRNVRLSHASPASTRGRPEVGMLLQQQRGREGCQSALPRVAARLQRTRCSDEIGSCALAVTHGCCALVIAGGGEQRRHLTQISSSARRQRPE
jgi:hypothetical protein